MVRTLAQPYSDDELDLLGSPTLAAQGEVDLFALRANLRLTPDERLERLEQHNAFVLELIAIRERHFEHLRATRASTPG